LVGISGRIYPVQIATFKGNIDTIKVMHDSFPPPFARKKRERLQGASVGVWDRERIGGTSSLGDLALFVFKDKTQLIF